MKTLDDQHLYEMATIDRHAILNKEGKSIQIHGSNSKDRENPHIHIYALGSKTQFNFEVSLVDIICYDEINLITMVDTKNHINIKNRSKCSWDGYSKMLEDFEEWLDSPNVKIPGDYKNNLDALVYWYNNESYDPKVDNPFLKYLSDRGLKVHDKYRDLFSEEDLKLYKT